MATNPITPSKPYLDIQYNEPPAYVIIPMRAAGLSDTQSKALLISLMRQTIEQVNAGGKVNWPGWGTFSLRYMSRNKVKSPVYGPNNLHINPCNMIAFRGNWRKAYYV